MIYYGASEELRTIAQGSIAKNEFFGLHDFLEERGVSFPQGFLLGQCRESLDLPGLTLYRFDCKTPSPFQTRSSDYIFCDLHLEITDSFFTAKFDFTSSVTWLNAYPDVLAAASTLIGCFYVSNYYRDDRPFVHVPPWLWSSSVETLSFTDCSLTIDFFQSVSQSQSLQQISFSTVGLPNKETGNFNDFGEHISTLLPTDFKLTRETFGFARFDRLSRGQKS